MTGHPEAADGGHASDPNAVVRYTVWAVYARTGVDLEGPEAAARELSAWTDRLAARDVVLRGFYDVSGMRPGADVMLWLHGPSAESLQAVLREFRRTRAGAVTDLAWSAMGTHRPAEFSRVQANTVAAFALNDWEWILALEADDLHDLVDLMRDLRSTQARRHVREEVPFHTGRLIEAAGVVDVLR